MTGGPTAWARATPCGWPGDPALVHRLDRLDADRLPFTFKVVLDNLLRQRGWPAGHPAADRRTAPTGTLG